MDIWSRSWLLRFPRRTRILVSDTTKRCLLVVRGSGQGPRRHGLCLNEHTIQRQGSLLARERVSTYTGLIVCEGAHSYNRRAHCCEGELVDAALSCGVQLVSQRPPAETLDLADVPAETLDFAVVPAETLDLADVPAETLDLADVPAETLDFAVVPAETLDLADVPAETLDFAVVPAETLDLADVPAETLDFAVVPAETLDLADVPAETLGNADVPAKDAPRPCGPGV